MKITTRIFSEKTVDILYWSTVWLVILASIVGSYYFGVWVIVPCVVINLLAATFYPRLIKWEFLP